MLSLPASFRAADFASSASCRQGDFTSSTPSGFALSGAAVREAQLASKRPPGQHHFFALRRKALKATNSCPFLPVVAEADRLHVGGDPACPPVPFGPAPERGPNEVRSMAERRRKEHGMTAQGSCIERQLARIVGILDHFAGFAPDVQDGPAASRAVCPPASPIDNRTDALLLPLVGTSSRRVREPRAGDGPTKEERRFDGPSLETAFL